MKINIKATGMDLTPALSDYVDKKISVLDKYFTSDDEGVMARVEIGKVTEHHKNGEIYRAEVHVAGGGYNLYASTEKEDLYASIDEVKDEITKELRRLKGKRFTVTKRGGEIAKNMLKGFTWRKGKFKPEKNKDNINEQ